MTTSELLAEFMKLPQLVADQVCAGGRIIKLCPLCQIAHDFSQHLPCEGAGCNICQDHGYVIAWGKTEEHNEHLRRLYERRQADIAGK